MYMAGFPGHASGGASGKEFVCQWRRHKRQGFDLWVGKIPWRRKWQPAPIFLLGKSHGQRSLVGFTPWDCKELDKTEWLRKHTYLLVQYLKLLRTLGVLGLVGFTDGWGWIPAWLASVSRVTGLMQAHWWVSMAPWYLAVGSRVYQSWY